VFKEFREFAMRGNVIDMAVGIIIGASFGAVVNSLVGDIIMPPIGVLLNNVDFTSLFVTIREGTVPGPYISIAAAKAAGAVTVNYGVFVSTIVSFLVVAFSVFLLIRSVNSFKRKETPPPPSTRECPYCLSAVPVGAVRCAHCTSELK
jgi:large conductance mechanosensitive channel